MRKHSLSEVTTQQKNLNKGPSKTYTNYFMLSRILAEATNVKTQYITTKLAQQKINDSILSFLL